MITLNQIKKRLVAFLERHKQISDVIYSDEFDFAAERSLNYPVANIRYQSASVDNTLLNYRFRVIIVDRVSVDPESEDEVFSDAILIANDFINFLFESQEWSFQRRTTLERISDSNGDRTSGVMFDFNLSVARNDSTCNAPLK